MKIWKYEDLTAAINTHGLSISEENDIQHGKQLQDTWGQIFVIDNL